MAPLPDRPYDVVLLHSAAQEIPGVALDAAAIAIRDGTIAALGSADAVRPGIGSATRVVDLRGRTVLPAFTDSHTHFHRGAILQRLYLDAETLQPATLAELLDHVRRRAESLGPGEWLQGDGLSAVRLAEGRLPTRFELDTVSPDHPVVLRGIGKHVVAANSAALAAAGIDRDTPDPPGGRIERDEQGDPTGILHETAKLRLDQSHRETVVPRPSAEDRRRALRAGFADLHRSGIATIHEMVRLPEEADDYAALRADGRLGVRVRLYYRVHESPISLDWLVQLGIRRGLGDAWLRILGVKISVDGFCIFRNAAVHEPYRNEPDNLGLLRIEPDRLTALVGRANAQGLQVAVHAVGARAVDHALDAFEAAGPAVAGPHRLEHGYLDVDAERLRRAAGLGLAWSTQPAFLAAYAREWAEAFDTQRIDRIMPLTLAPQLGIPLLLNSDFPCAPFDPIAGIRCAVSRGLPTVDAWRAFTTGPADVAGEPSTGRIAVGSPADLVVLDEDPFASPSTLASASVRATMIDGSFVFGGDEVGG